MQIQTADQARTAIELAETLMRAGASADALSLVTAVLRFDAGHAGANMLMGVLLFSRGAPDSAEVHFAAAAQAAPDNPDHWVNLAKVRLENLAPHTALQAADRALTIRGDHHEAMLCRGQALVALNEPEGAANAFETCLHARPQWIDARVGMAQALRLSGRTEEALALCRQCLARDSSHVPTLIEFATIHLETGGADFAADLFSQVLDVSPRHQGALAGRAVANWNRHRHADTRRDLEALRAMKARTPGLAVRLRFARAIDGDWSEHATLVDEAKAELARAHHATLAAPWLYLGLCDAPDEIARATGAYARLLHAPPPLPEPPAPHRARRDAPLRVAVVSADFRHHPCAKLMASLAERLDRSAIELVGVTLNAPDDSRTAQRLIGAMDEMIDCAGLSDPEAASALRAAQADIAVDLCGYTSAARPRIFIDRVAPVQVNFLGYAGSMHHPAWDYIITDRRVTPLGAEGQYSEKICALPHCFLPTDPGLRPGPAPVRRAVGLPEDAFVFASFNNNWKVTPALFAVWMELLRQRPSSVLWMWVKGSRAAENMKAHARACRVDPDRIIIALPTPSDADYLARLQLGDLHLDTFPYGAHSTASDALLAGVPTLTVTGQCIHSRVCTSIMTAHGFPELAADSVDAYAQRALRLSEDLAQLEEIKLKIRTSIDRSALFDMAGYARAFEHGLLTMAQRVRSGLAPQSFDVPALP